MKHNTVTTPIMHDTNLFLETQQPTTADLTPMLDTIFLIILLLLATLINSSIVRGFPVNLPAFSEETAIQKENDAIEVSIAGDGSIYIAKEKFDLLGITQALQAASGQDSRQKVLLRADTSVPYGRVAQVLCHISNSLPDKQVILITQEIYTETEPGNLQKKVVQK